MKTLEHLLVCLSEECVEVSKEVSKALRFGLEDFNPKTNVQNKEAIARELNDLLAVVEMLADDFNAIDQDLVNNFVNKQIKKHKVETYMEYAIEKGTLDEGN